MPKKKPLVVVTRRLPEEIETRMCELFDVRLNETDKPLSQEELAEAMRVADVLVPTITDRIDAHLIEQAGENMKLIANFGAGYEHIDLAAARERAITVRSGGLAPNQSLACLGSMAAFMVSPTLSVVNRRLSLICCSVRPMSVKRL